MLAKNIILYCLCAILIYYVYTLFHVSQFIMYVFKLLFPLIIALFFHFLLEPIIDYFTSDRLKRKIVVVYVYLIMSLLGIIICYFIAPYLIAQCSLFYNQCFKQEMHLSPVISMCIEFLQKYRVIDYIMRLLNEWTKSLFYWVSNILIAVGISFYLSYDHLHLIENMIAYIPFEKQGLWMQTLKKLKITTYQFMKSLVLDFIVFFVLCLCTFVWIEPKLCLWIALFLSITNLIPYIGPYIGAIPIIIYEYLTHSELGIISFIIIVIIQYFESSYIQPYLFSKCIHIHPVILIISLSLFGDLFGIVGMIFSPLLVCYVLYVGELLKKLHIFTFIKRIFFQFNKE